MGRSRNLAKEPLKPACNTPELLIVIVARDNHSMSETEAQKGNRPMRRQAEATFKCRRDLIRSTREYHSRPHQTSQYRGQTSFRVKISEQDRRLESPDVDQTVDRSDVPTPSRERCQVIAIEADPFEKSRI
jgi:hypothetical protein